MKNLILILIAFCLVAISSCYKSDKCSELSCYDNCEFVEVDRVAVTHFYGCYDVWGVVFTNDSEEQVIGLAPNMRTEYQVEDMEITFSATFYENDLPLAFPDPMPGRFYKIDICGMSDDSN